MCREAKSASTCKVVRYQQCSSMQAFESAAHSQSRTCVPVSKGLVEIAQQQRACCRGTARRQGGLSRLRPGHPGWLHCLGILAVLNVQALQAASAVR